jgi:Protein of unknown function (DUF1592)/Protein of unknown function (DUF1588)/Protein of unknown function (DUF1585)
MAACAVPDPSPRSPSWTLAAPGELAGRLSRLLWHGDPDDSVLQALAAKPRTPEGVSQVAAGMLSDRRGRDGIRAFFKWWLLLDTLPALEKDDLGGVLDGRLRASMVEEAPALGVYLTLETTGTFPELLRAPFTFMDERLARHYGITGVSGDELRKVPYPPEQPRVGVMSGAGVLSLFASLADPSWPAKRGWLVTDQLLCTPVIRSFLPPPSIDRQRSIRSQMIEMTKNVACTGCHKVLDSPGFAFIGFDSFGRWRPEAGHGPGETAGWIPSEIMPDSPKFDGAAELAELLAVRKETARCFVRQWLQYALDPRGVVRGPISEDLAASVASALGAFEHSGLVLRELVLAITRTEAFTRP